VFIEHRKPRLDEKLGAKRSAGANISIEILQRTGGIARNLFRQRKIVLSDDLTSCMAWRA
jgi:hypothetical protein